MSHDSHLYWLPELLDYEFQFENEYSLEWKKHLLNKNLEEIEKTENSSERFTFYQPEIVNCVFDLCQMFKQPPEVRYLAVDILDRFLVHHFREVFESFRQMEDQSRENWKIITDRMLGQSLLRILTCIQLAVKYCWNCGMITARTIQEVMEAIGHTWQFSKKSIVKSEARVYSNLNFNIPSCTPLTYLEMFFDQFRLPGILQLGVPLDEFFITSIHTLDIAIIHHQQIYSSLLELLNTTFEENLYEKCSLLSLKGDSVTLAASVVFASSMFVNPESNNSDYILEIICSIGECRRYTVHMLGMQVLDIIKEYLCKDI